MNIKTALEALGVRGDTLTPAEHDALDRDGFLPLPGILTEQQIAAIRTRLDELLVREGDEAGKEVHQEAGTDRLSDLVNKGAIFAVCFTHPRVLAAIAHVLRGAFKLSSLNARSALPGQGCKRCTRIGAGQSNQVAMLSATRSGCWTISPSRMAPRGLSPAASAAARCRVT